MLTTEEFDVLIKDPSKWPHFMSLLNTAARIVGEAEGNGYVLVPSESGLFDRTTDIEKLRGAITLISPGMVFEGDELPHLTDEQNEKLMEVAIEIQAAGNGTGDEDDDEARVNAKSNVETMTPLERLNSLPDDQDWRINRLGFDPLPNE